MRVRVRVALAVLALPFLIASQAGVRQSKLFDSAQLLADLRILSADDMQGRQAGTPGGEKARAYVVERFKASGIQAFADSYAHPFTFTSGRGEAVAERKAANVLGFLAGSQ